MQTTSAFTRDVAFGLRIGYGIAAASTAAALRSHASSDGVNIIAARAADAALADPNTCARACAALPMTGRRF